MSCEAALYSCGREFKTKIVKEVVMLKTVKIAVLILVCAFLAHPAFSAAAEPPDGVEEVIEQMSEMEGSFEAGKWSEAQDAYKKIVKAVDEILEQSQLEDQSMNAALESLGKYLNDMNEKQVEAQYIRFQKQFFQFITRFEYEVHPILHMIQQYVVDESAEAYANKDYKDVVNEMREAGNLIDHAKPLLVEKGIPEQEVDEFKNQIIDLIMAGKKDDYQRMGELLEQIKSTYGSFMTRYMQK